jgi:hypothetical protein
VGGAVEEELGGAAAQSAEEGRPQSTRVAARPAQTTAAATVRSAPSFPASPPPLLLLFLLLLLLHVLLVGNHTMRRGTAEKVRTIAEERVGWRRWWQEAAVLWRCAANVAGPRTRRADTAFSAEDDGIHRRSRYSVTFAAGGGEERESEREETATDACAAAKTQGLFRVSGGAEEIRALKDLIEQGTLLEFTLFCFFSVSLIGRVQMLSSTCSTRAKIRTRFPRC